MGKSRKAVFYGNCQARAICDILKAKYGDDGCAFEYVCNFGLAPGTEPPPSFRECDFFIFQPLHRDDVWGTKRVLADLKSGCRTISFAYLYFLGLFPDYMKDPQNNITIGPEYPFGKFPYGYSSLRSAMCEGREVRVPVLGSVFVKERLKMSLDTLREKEVETDIRVADFIEREFRRQLLFTAVNHPTNIVLREVARSVAAFLGLDPIRVDCILKEPEYIRGESDSAVWPSVHACLGLEFDLPLVRTLGREMHHTAHLRAYCAALYPRCSAFQEL